MKALVIGASGLVGSHLLRVGRERFGAEAVGGTAHSQEVPGLEPLDVTDAGAVRALLARTRPEVVFMPAANPNVDLCETSPEATRPVNVQAVRTVAEGVGEQGGSLVYYSSDYVFDGAAGPYRETDRPSPICRYGEQKLEAERIAAAVLPRDHLVLRTTVVYGWERQGKNFLARLLRTLRAGERMRAPRDQLGSPTLVDDLADASWELAERGARGTYHVAGTEWMDRYAFAVRAAETFQLDPSLIEPVATEALGQPARRPLRAGMHTDKAAALLGRPLVGATAGLEWLRDTGSHEER